MKPIFLFLAILLLFSGCATSPGITEASLPPSEGSVPEPIHSAVTAPTDPMEALLENMTVPEKVGQLFLARCPDSFARDDIQKYHLGGYILFAPDFEGRTPESLQQVLQSYQEAADIPMLIAVDEEGGTVCRVSKNPYFRHSPFPSPRKAYQMGGLDMARSMEAEKAILLQSLGIHVCMGPVCDIATEPGAFMYSRSLGQNPETTGQFVQQTVGVYAEYGIGSVLKHFPGYGNNSDTHTGAAVDKRSLETLEKRDLIPFAAGIEAGCGAILVSHTTVSAFDETLPASLSPVVHAYLRNTMDFEGVIITDDLIMDAIRAEYGTGEAAVLAILAGNDLLCSTEYPEQYSAVLEAVESGRIPMELLDQAVTRILRWKQALGLLP